MTAVMRHEVIDYSPGVQIRNDRASLKHLFFDSEPEARAYMHARPRNEMNYQHRAWGPEALAELWIVDHRKCANPTTPPPPTSSPTT